MVEVLFVHGALVRDGAWWRQRVADALEHQAGVTSRAVALPSCGEGAAPGSAGLVEDARALSDALDGVDEAVVVGHSYGGTVMAEGADHRAVRHLVYITSYLPDPGQAHGDLFVDEPDPVVVAPNDDGTLGVPGYSAAALDERLWQDVPDEETRAAARVRVTTQAIAAFGTPTTRAAWRSSPSTYLVYTDDRNTTVGLQRFHAARATRSFELPTGHHPFLSRPDLVTDRLVEVLRAG